MVKFTACTQECTRLVKVCFEEVALSEEGWERSKLMGRGLGSRGCGFLDSPSDAFSSRIGSFNGKIFEEYNRSIFLVLL